jgi:hypothetical protein
VESAEGDAISELADEL